MDRKRIFSVPAGHDGTGREYRWWLPGLWLAAAAALYAVCGFSAQFFRGAVLAAFLVPVGVFDYHRGLIHDRLLGPMALAGLVLSAGRPLTEILGSAALGSALLLVVRLASRGGMGGGDIKFMAALGCWFSWPMILWTLLLAFGAGGLTAAALLASGRKKRRDAIPFGPFLAGSAMAVFLWGGRLTGWYRGFFYG